MGYQDAYREEMVVARAGQIMDCAFNDTISRINDDPAALQVDTIVIDTEQNNYDYTVTVEDIPITYTSDATATKAEIANGLAAALNAEQLTNGRYRAVSDGVDTITVTARYKGVGWTMTESDANMTLTHTTANAEADPVPFGLGLIYDPEDAQFARLPKAASLAKQKVDLVPTVDNNTLYEVTVIVLGAPYTGSFTSDADATAEEIVDGMKAALDAVLPANTVAVTEDNTKITLESEVEGQPFELGFLETRWTRTDVTITGLTDIARCFQGVSQRDSSVETDSSGVTQYPARSVMNVLRRGRIWVTTEALVAIGDKVYLRIDGSGTIGAFTNSPTATEHLEIKGARWVDTIDASLAGLELDAR